MPNRVNRLHWLRHDGVTLSHASGMTRGGGAIRAALHLATVAALLAALAVTVAPAAAAREINLGGRQSIDGQGADANKEFHLPANTVALPTLLAPVRDQASGQMRSVRVDAYLSSNDGLTAARTSAAVKQIATVARQVLPGKSADVLLSPINGPVAVRKAILTAVEHVLGPDWKGTVYIRSMTVF